MSVCRTCLSVNSRMHDLRTNRLRHIFENLTNVQMAPSGALAGPLEVRSCVCCVQVGVEEMSAICYICYSQLRRCQRFVNMSQTADRILRQAFSKQTELISVTAGELVATNALVVTPVEVMSLGEPPGGADPRVKQESVPVKEEGDEEEQELQVELQLPLIKLEDLGSLPDPGHDTSTPGAEYTCNECGKGFRAQRNLSRHVLHVHTRKKVPCEHCHGEYATRYYKKHILCCKAIAGKKLHGQTANDKGRVPRRRRRPERRFACDYCRREFDQKGALASHLRVHTGERPYACARCARRFSQASSLRKHAASHAQLKRYFCDVCRKGFVHKPSLAAHVRTHAGERPHRCRRCGKGFSQRGHMRLHQRAHDGLKPYSCRVCGAAFGYRSTARRHERRHERRHGPAAPPRLAAQ